MAATVTEKEEPEGFPEKKDPIFDYNIIHYYEEFHGTTFAENVKKYPKGIVAELLNHLEGIPVPNMNNHFGPNTVSDKIKPFVFKPLETCVRWMTGKVGVNPIDYEGLQNICFAACQRLNEWRVRRNLSSTEGPTIAKMGFRVKLDEAYQPGKVAGGSKIKFCTLAEADNLFKQFGYFQYVEIPQGASRTAVGFDEELSRTQVLYYLLPYHARKGPIRVLRLDALEHLAIRLLSTTMISFDPKQIDLTNKTPIRQLNALSLLMMRMFLLSKLYEDLYRRGYVTRKGSFVVRTPTATEPAAQAAFGDIIAPFAATLANQMRINYTDLTEMEKDDFCERKMKTQDWKDEVKLKFDLWIQTWDTLCLGIERSQLYRGKQTMGNGFLMPVVHLLEMLGFCVAMVITEPSQRNKNLFMATCKRLRGPLQELTSKMEDYYGRHRPGPGYDEPAEGYPAYFYTKLKLDTKTSETTAGAHQEIR